MFALQNISDIQNRIKWYCFGYTEGRQWNGGSLLCHGVWCLLLSSVSTNLWHPHVPKYCMCYKPAFSVPISTYVFLKFLFICMYVCMCTHMLWHVCGGQKATYRSWFSPTTLWVLGTEPNSSGLIANPSCSPICSTVLKVGIMVPINLFWDFALTVWVCITASHNILLKSLFFFLKKKLHCQMKSSNSFSPSFLRNLCERRPISVINSTAGHPGIRLCNPFSLSRMKSKMWNAWLPG